MVFYAEGEDVFAELFAVEFACQATVVGIRAEGAPEMAGEFAQDLFQRGVFIMEDVGGPGGGIGAFRLRQARDPGPRGEFGMHPAGQDHAVLLADAFPGSGGGGGEEHAAVHDVHGRAGFIRFNLEAGAEHAYESIRGRDFKGERLVAFYRIIYFSGLGDGPVAAAEAVAAETERGAGSEGGPGSVGQNHGLDARCGGNDGPGRRTEQEQAQDQRGEGAREGIAPYWAAEGGAPSRFGGFLGGAETPPGLFGPEASGFPMLRDEAQDIFLDFFHFGIVSAPMTQDSEKSTICLLKKNQASGRVGNNRMKSRMLSALLRRL